MSAFARALSLVVAALLLGAGCVGQRARRDLALPPQTRLYVAVFVDETDGGGVGLPLTEAIRYEVYRRAPARLAMSFDETSFALDGTVVKLEELPVQAGHVRVRVRVQALARLVNIRGEEVSNLGDFTAEARYVLARDDEESDERRTAAIRQAVNALARDLVDRLHERRGGDDV
jgi:hypothetical protein